MIAEQAVFTDTSAFYALMDRSDQHHEQARDHFGMLLENEYELTTSNYVVVETTALLQNRLGFGAADLWYRDILGIVDVLWIEPLSHELAFELWLSLGRRKLSLVDCTSFIVMRQHKIGSVYGFDRHFKEHGFSAFG